MWSEPIWAEPIEVVNLGQKDWPKLGVGVTDLLQDSPQFPSKLCGFARHQGHGILVDPKQLQLEMVLCCWLCCDTTPNGLSLRLGFVGLGDKELIPVAFQGPEEGGSCLFDWVVKFITMGQTSLECGCRHSIRSPSGGPGHQRGSSGHGHRLGESVCGQGHSDIDALPGQMPLALTQFPSGSGLIGFALDRCWGKLALLTS